MNKWIKSLIILPATLIFVFLILILFNNIVGFSSNMEGLYPGSGRYFFNGLLSLSVILLLAPFYSFFSFRKLPVYYPGKDSENEKNLSKLIKYLKKNPILKNENIQIETEDDVRKACLILKKAAEEESIRMSELVFLSTAISQNGKLDSLIVLWQQMILVYRITRIYAGRVSIRGIFRLYYNVAVSAFLAKTIEDIDLEEYLEPVFEELLASIAIGAISPRLTAVILTIVTSMLDGASNAFLTLRVGMITSELLYPFSPEDEGKLKKKAISRAAFLLFKVVGNTGGKVISSIKRSAGKASKKGMKKMSDLFKWKNKKDDLKEN